MNTVNLSDENSQQMNSTDSSIDNDLQNMEDINVFVDRDPSNFIMTEKNSEEINESSNFIAIIKSLEEKFEKLEKKLCNYVEKHKNLKFALKCNTFVILLFITVVGIVLTTVNK